VAVKNLDAFSFGPKVGEASSLKPQLFYMGKKKLSLRV